MATIRRLPCFELLFLFVGVWLCLALEPNAAARLPSDRFVFPSEYQPNLESRLMKVDMEIDREIEDLLRLMMMPQEAKKGIPKVTQRTVFETSPIPPRGECPEGLILTVNNRCRKPA